MIEDVDTEPEKFVSDGIEWMIVIENGRCVAVPSPTYVVVEVATGKFQPHMLADNGKRIPVGRNTYKTVADAAKVFGKTFHPVLKTVGPLPPVDAFALFLVGVAAAGLAALALDYDTQTAIVSASLAGTIYWTRWIFDAIYGQPKDSK